MSKDVAFDPEVLAGELFAALDPAQPPAALFSARYPAMTIDQAYAVSLGVLNRRLARGEKLTGKKIGLTAKAVQEALGIDEPDFGFLTDAMTVTEGATVSTGQWLRAPLVEPEIAFVLKQRLSGPGVTAQDVLAATEYVTPCFEIVDSRFDTPQIRIVDTVADNASGAAYVLGDARIDPAAIDLAAVTCRVSRNGELVQEGAGAAVMDNPLNSVAWLANCLGRFDVALEAGDVVLPGSMTPFIPVRPGDRFVADMGLLGSVSIDFD